MEDIQALYDKLLIEGRLKSAKPAERNGVTDEPMLKPGGYLNSHQFISCLHARINSLTWCQNMGHHYNARDAFPNQIPIRGLGKKKSAAQKKAVELSAIEWKMNAKYGEYFVKILSLMQI